MLTHEKLMDFEAQRGVLKIPIYLFDKGGGNEVVTQKIREDLDGMGNAVADRSIGILLKYNLIHERKGREGKRPAKYYSLTDKGTSFVQTLLELERILDEE